MIRIFVLRKYAKALEPTGQETCGVAAAAQIERDLNIDAKRHGTGEVFLAINDEPFTPDEKEIYEELAKLSGY